VAEVVPIVAVHPSPATFFAAMGVEQDTKDGGEDENDITMVTAEKTARAGDMDDCLRKSRYNTKDMKRRLRRYNARPTLSGTHSSRT
jgi:hypothetical protein